jgi:ectoine hydroxylase-related dioxygenase (phytanoyl-CoA dioxygenase family)
MVICKQPEIGGAVPPHQDSTFLYTDPPSAIGFWYALEDATTENGCLSFAKGSHKRAEIKRRFVRQGIGADGEWETGFVDVDGARFPRGLEREREAQNGGTVKGQPRSHAKLTGETQKEGGVEKEEEYTIGPVKAGTLVLIHGNVLHKSEKNLSGKSRFIYTFHVIEGDNEYDERNWLQPPEEGFSRL